MVQISQTIDEELLSCEFVHIWVSRTSSHAHPEHACKKCGISNLNLQLLGTARISRQLRVREIALGGKAHLHWRVSWQRTPACIFGTLTALGRRVPW